MQRVNNYNNDITYHGKSNCKACTGGKGLQTLRDACKSGRHAQSQLCAANNTFGKASGLSCK